VCDEEDDDGEKEEENMIFWHFQNLIKITMT